MNEKKEISLQQILQAIKTKSVTNYEEDGTKHEALLLVSSANNAKKTFNVGCIINGEENSIAAMVASKMITDDDFCRLILKACYAFTEQQKRDMTKALDKTVNTLGNFINELESIVGGKKPSRKKRPHRR